VAGRVRLAVPVTEAFVTNLNEERQGEADAAGDGSLAVAVPPGKIVTLEIVV
jgi:hypothetical protein